MMMLPCSSYEIHCGFSELLLKAMKFLCFLKFSANTVMIPFFQIKNIKTCDLDSAFAWFIRTN